MDQIHTLITYINFLIKYLFINWGDLYIKYKIIKKFLVKSFYLFFSSCFEIFFEFFCQSEAPYIF